MQKHDTVIIGGGQAGLALSYYLSQQGREHVILERARVAERWRSERWDSLCFQLPNHWLSLPGKPYQGNDPDGFSHHHDVIKLVADYANEIKAPLRLGVDAQRISAKDEDGYLIETSSGPLQTKKVVLATGPFQHALIPDFAKGIAPEIVQIDTQSYRNPAALPPGAVLVVGSGNSGCQIAHELLQSGRRVFLSTSIHTRVPRRYRGRDVIWWYDKLGRFDIDIKTLPGNKIPPTTLMTGFAGGYDISPRLLAMDGVRLIGRVLGHHSGLLALADNVPELIQTADRSQQAFIDAADNFARVNDEGAALAPKPDAPAPEPPVPIDRRVTLDLRAEKIGTIVWTSGFRFGFDWIDLPIVDGQGTPIQTRGVTPCPGVYFLGLHWMHNFRSAILAYVGRDADYIAAHMDRLDKR